MRNKLKDNIIEIPKLTDLLDLIGEMQLFEGDNQLFEVKYETVEIPNIIKGRQFKGTLPLFPRTTAS
jgi:hypothetical protein